MLLGANRMLVSLSAAGFCHSAAAAWAPSAERNEPAVTWRHSHSTYSSLNWAWPSMALAPMMVGAGTQYFSSPLAPLMTKLSDSAANRRVPASCIAA